jgi:hypothetical protein
MLELIETGIAPFAPPAAEEAPAEEVAAATA